MIYQVVGIFICVVFALAVAALAVMGAIHQYHKYRDLQDYKVRALAARDIGRQMWSAGWWFESDDAKRVLQLVGISLQVHGMFDVDKIRNAWREGGTADVSKL